MIQKINYDSSAWIDIKNPRQKDVDFISKKFPFIHDTVLDEIIPPGHRAKVEKHKDYMFMIIYYPIFNPAHKTTQSRELDIIITKDHIVTSHYKTLIPLKRLFDQTNLYKEKKEEVLSEGTAALLHHIIIGMLGSAFNKLDIIEKNIDEIEDAIFEEKKGGMVREISLTKRDILNFRRILAPQQAVFESLYNEGVAFFGEQVIPYLEDVLGYYSRLWNFVENQKETIQALSETNDSLLNTKINEIIKVLTLFSVIVFPLTLLSSIWGMNTTYLPFLSIAAPWDFISVMGVMMTLSAGMLMYFKKKKWL